MNRKLFSEDVFVVLLAGGRGVRFWPLSQENRPKQFLKIFGKDPLIVSTLKRIKKAFPLKQIYIVTNKEQSTLLNKQLSRFRFPKKNILLEPEGKNTAPAIGWAAIEIRKQNPDGVMVVMPCDHLIGNVRYFYKDLIKAARTAKADKLVIFGIRPTRVEIGYGYIKSQNYAKINKFIEKPNEKIGRKLIKTRSCFWNSGIFIWKTDRILKEIRLHSPSLFKNLSRIRNKKSLKNIWRRIKPVSIDIAVLEKSHNVFMHPANFSWDDLGSWRTWSELMKKDKSGNYFAGNCKDLGSKNTTILNDDKKQVMTLGLKDLIVVNTKDGLLVCHKDKTQDVKKLIG